MTVGEAITILMVEDDPGDARLIRTLLDRTALKPFQLKAVDRVAKGVELLRQNGKVDVVLLDVSLPDSRAGTLDSLRRIQQAAPDLPLLLLTGIDDEELAVRAVREGAQDYLVKQKVDAGLLGRAIRYAIERKRAEVALRESQERYELAVQGAKDGLWDWDLRQDSIYFSPRWKSMLGFEEGEIGEDPAEWFDRVHPDDLPAVRLALSEHLTGRAPAFESEHRMLHASGGYRWVLTRGLAVRNAGGNGDGDAAYRMAGSQSDITARKAAEERLLHDAFHDPLTGLPNRALFMDRLGMAIAHAKRRLSYTFAVLFIDLDRFKNVNDSLGHSVGDELLVAVARRLESCLRPGDTVARLGGDEFTILLDEVTDVEHAVQVAQRMHRELARPFRVQGHEVFVTMSLGITVGAGGDYDRPEDVLRDADTAMYGAKASGKSRDAVFDPQHARPGRGPAAARDRPAAGGRAFGVRDPLSADRLALERQDRRLRGAAALAPPAARPALPGQLRAGGRGHGAHRPHRLVGAARGLQPARGLAVAALGAASTWLSASTSRAGSSCRRTWSSRIEDILHQTGIRSGSLRLEITESTIMEQAEDAIAKLLALAPARGQALHRRLRHRLLVAQLSPPPAGGRPEDRPLLRQRDGHRRRALGDRGHHRHPGPDSRAWTSPPKASRPPSRSPACAPSPATTARATSSPSPSAAWPPAV